MFVAFGRRYVSLLGQELTWIAGPLGSPLYKAMFRHFLEIASSAGHRLSPARVETKAEYLKRLRRCALKLPKSVVEPAVMDMRRRLRLIAEANGSLFKG